MSRRAVAATLATVLAIALTSLGAPLTAPASADPVTPSAVVAPVPVIDWDSCGGRAQCDTVQVPLDYDDPTGRTTDLDLLRMRATRPADKIGTLFVNPGGPGGSSREFAFFFHQLVPKEIQQRFDVVGIDPRGVGESRPMVCRTDRKQPHQPFQFFPVTHREVKRWIAFDKWQRRACRDGAAAIVDHMSTADTARDMDLIRQAVGDDQLHYYGISYGTQLGSTYAAMFPDEVGSMILDGVLDPVAWSTGTAENSDQPFSERLDSGRGAFKTLTSAFRECDRVGHKRCPIAGNAVKVWKHIIHHLRKGRDKRTGFTYADVVGLTLGSLYDPSGIRSVMRALNNINRTMFGSRPVTGRVWPSKPRGSNDRHVPGPYAGFTGHDGATTSYGRVFNSGAGVMCADSDNPTDERDWVKAARRADERAPWFGAAWTWISGVCAGWPRATKEDRFTGPYDATTASPVLITGNTFDPATPISGARAVNRNLAGSRLLVMDGWGHGALGESPCVDRAWSAYLLEGTLPAQGKVCPQRGTLFPKKK